MEEQGDESNIVRMRIKIIAQANTIRTDTRTSFTTNRLRNTTSSNYHFKSCHQLAPSTIIGTIMTMLSLLSANLLAIQVGAAININYSIMSPPQPFTFDTLFATSNNSTPAQQLHNLKSNNYFKSFSQAPLVNPKVTSTQEHISKNLARLPPKQQLIDLTTASTSTVGGSSTTQSSSINLIRQTKAQSNPFIQQSQPSTHNQHRQLHNHNYNQRNQHQYNNQVPQQQLNHNNYNNIREDQQYQSHSINQHQQLPPLSSLTRICIGTSNKLTNQHNRSDHYQNLVDRYKDCTNVIGNLEITWLERGRDLSFLESIREISGYLLIANVEVERIRLPNLQIIRGRDQYSHDGREFALFVFDNEFLKTLELPNLTEILAGSFGSYHNKNLCYLNTINWEEILHPRYESYNVYDGTQPSCPNCNDKCVSGCWGEGPDACQRFTKIGCTCGQQGRCYGPSPGDCCHSYCAGGCTGPKETNCLACKNFYDDGTCVPECPSMMRYNSEAFLWEPNPKGKYAFGAFCVKDCPEHLLRDNGACVRTCPANKRSVNGECVSCGGPCPKNCQGVEVVHSGNIDQLINCTIIEGSITISDLSFYGATNDQLIGTANNINDTTTLLNGAISINSPSTTIADRGTGSTTTTGTTIGSGTSVTTKYKPMHPNRLEALKNLREITGYLNIQQASHPEFKNLSFFRNLMFIGGRQATDYSLSIIKTSLVSLNLHSLRKVKSGKILIEDNKNLCFADTIEWAQTNITRKDEITTRNNAESSKCRSMGLQCHEQCARDGCWGSGPDECLSCNNYKLDDYCVDNCSSSLAQIGLLSYVDGPRICKKCHSECAKGCRGSEAKNCFECKNVKDGPFCVPECPSHKYNKDGICKACDQSCLDGCTGPSNKLGEGGCNSCSKVVLNSTDGTNMQAHCIMAEDNCPEGFYQEYVGPQHSLDTLLKSSSGKPVCRKCHHRCKSCTGMGTHTSVCVCSKYVAGEQCEESCPRDHYEDEQSRRCLQCSSECNGCYGPTEADCITCRVYRIYHNPFNQIQETQSVSAENPTMTSIDPLITKAPPRFNCTAQCPADKPRRISDSTMLDPYCSEDDGVDLENTKKNSLSTAYLAMSVVFFGAIMCCLSIRRFQQQTDKTVKLTMHLSGIDDVEPLHPSNLKPNLAPLRSIKETELRKGKILGSGFGGTVYQGLWYPETQEHNKKPWPVAIKVLRDNGESNMNKEFLDEAYIMASVNHPNLVRLLAVCMTPSHLMLVTQLMPLGCLLDYVKKHRDDIGSKNLFEWCKQIARGMAYLEEHRMVHRDLALRNVLLQKSGRALVSDFGLAKFLDVDKSEYRSGGGRLPIKWLAPECIRERKFTHKSDVWAFGVTVWELLTFGWRPFEEYSTREVFNAIESGARLCQPSWMTTEVYKVMYACWFYNPDERPDFKGLVQNFVNFARDPERYLICHSKGIDYSLNIETPGKNGSDCDDNMMLGEDYSSDTNDFTEDDSQPPGSASVAPELTPSTHNRLNEMHAFGFELRNNNNNSTTNNNNIDSETETQTATPICKSRMNLFPGSPRRIMDDGIFIAKMNTNHHHHNHHHQNHENLKAHFDMNNNTNIITTSEDHEPCCRGSMHQTMSTNSLAHKSDQPTDGYDYLIPSPSTNEPSQFGSFYGATIDRLNSIPITPTSSKATSTLPLRNPPHSAGPIGVDNEEYFNDVRVVNYVNHKWDLNNRHSRITNTMDHRLCASNNDIPYSLV